VPNHSSDADTSSTAIMMDEPKIARWAFTHGVDVGGGRPHALGKITGRYAALNSFWISSSGTPLVSGIRNKTQSNCSTIIPA